jgi:putative ABC transport system ATP-binding protein
MASCFIKVQDVSRHYRRAGGLETKALDHINLEIAEGDFIALMGPSGSGKSTLLNIIAGIDRPTDGSVSVGGVEINTLKEKHLARWRNGHLGFIFQSFNLIPVLTAFENVEVPLLLTRMSRKERRRQVHTALKLVGLADYTTSYPRQLSGGQEQRVAIARALAGDPSLLLVDEPTGSLDASAAKDVLRLLSQLNDDFGKTIIMVTHDPNAAKYAKRICHLDKGILDLQSSLDGGGLLSNEIHATSLEKFMEQ